MTDFLRSLAPSRAAGQPLGITSVCSAHPIVLRAAARHAARHGDTALIEATCNQVNQFGGYTGMTPADFAAKVRDIARREGLAETQLILGGDHLGPNPWRKEPAAAALAHAAEMIEAYVAAGFRKLHLDCSMGCAGEPEALDDATTAGRAVALATAAERAAQKAGGALPLYIIGTEVPPPGGATHVIDDVTPTAPEAAERTLAVHREAFAKAGLTAAFGRVIAIVVQPGVEFGNANVHVFERARAAPLSALLTRHPSLVYEAHSTDYQPGFALHDLVADGYQILKVGPELTFALREALYGLDLVASDAIPGYGGRPLHFAMERLMTGDPRHWQGHYHGSPAELMQHRHYSLSDRIRYYWAQPAAEAAVARLTAVLTGQHLPAPLLRQHLPAFAGLANQPFAPETVMLAAVEAVLDRYRDACRPSP